MVFSDWAIYAPILICCLLIYAFVEKKNADQYYKRAWVHVLSEEDKGRHKEKWKNSHDRYTGAFFLIFILLVVWVSALSA